MGDVYMGSDAIGSVRIDDPLADIFFLAILGFFIFLIVGAIKTSKNVQEKTDGKIEKSTDTSEYIDDDI